MAIVLLTTEQVRQIIANWTLPYLLNLNLYIVVTLVTDQTELEVF